MEVLGPEHEFSVVNSRLGAQPIVDKILKDFHGHVVNFVRQKGFTFGKELQMHVMEVKANAPFRSPLDFENTMQEAVLFLQELLHSKYELNLLGCGMHPFLAINDTYIWPHRDKRIYDAYSRIFDLRRHGWLNVQSFQLNLPYGDELSGIAVHNALADVCAYLPAISASSPIYEGRFGKDVDNRLRFYMENQREIKSVTGDVIPEYVSSFAQYEKDVIGRYSADLARSGADDVLLFQEWVNSRGVIFRFDRKALELRVMDEQECVKSDVALSCFVRALLRGLIDNAETLVSHGVLVRNFLSSVKNGLNAKVVHSRGKTAREVCLYLYEVAWGNASDEEREYLPLIKKRIELGSLSEVLRTKIETKAKKTDFKEAVCSVYLKLVKSLIDNEPYF